jgi:hypothetical protein
MSQIQETFDFAKYRIYQDGTIATALYLKVLGKDQTFHFEKDENQQVINMKIDSSSKILKFIPDSQPMSNTEWTRAVAATARHAEGKYPQLDSIVFESIYGNVLFIAYHSFENSKTVRLAYEILPIAKGWDLLKLDINDEPSDYQAQIDDPIQTFVDYYTQPDEDTDLGIFGKL